MKKKLLNLIYKNSNSSRRITVELLKLREKQEKVKRKNIIPNIIILKEKLENL